MKQLILLILLAPSICLAAGGPDHVPSIADTVTYWLNFIIFSSILFYFVRKPTVNFWRTRRETLEEQILRGERELEAANAKVLEAKQLYESADKEVTEIKTTIAKETELEAAKVIESAKEQAERIKTQAARNAESENNAVKHEIQKEFAEKVYQTAKTKLKQEFTSDYDAEYRKSALSGLKNLIGVSANG